MLMTGTAACNAAKLLTDGSVAKRLHDPEEE